MKKRRLPAARVWRLFVAGASIDELGDALKTTRPFVEAALRRHLRRTAHNEERFTITEKGRAALRGAAP